MLDFSRRDFLCSSLAVGGIGAFTPSALAIDKPYLKVGFLTDTHLRQTRQSADRVRGAFQIFRDRGVDAIGHCGDLADYHYVEAYAHYRDVIEATYPDPAKRPELLYVYANHDAFLPGNKAKIDSDSNLKKTLEEAFADMRERLNIPHGLFHETTLAGVPFLILPQSISTFDGYQDVERRLTEICKRHRTGPVVVMAHLPPMGTVYESGNWGDVHLRAVLDKFPRVISFTGHTHNSLRNELCIWQGRFTAVDVGCLQQWEGMTVGTPVKSKQAYDVLVAEFHPGRIVIRRFDVRDGHEHRPDRPWTIALPFAPKSAPLAGPTRAKAERPAAFSPDARIAFAVDAEPFDAVTISFPAAISESEVLNYRIEVERRSNGGWERFLRGDIFSSFYMDKAERSGSYMRRYSALCFREGGIYRFSVTPVGFFGTTGAPLSCEWTAPHKVLYRKVFLSENPMRELSCHHAWPSGDDVRRAKAPLTPMEGEWYVVHGATTCQTWFELPRGVWKAKKGTMFRVAADVRARQQNGVDGWNVSLMTPDGARRCPCGWTTLPDGESGLLRLVFEFEAKSDALPEYALNFARGQKGLLRLERLEVESRPGVP